MKLIIIYIHIFYIFLNEIREGELYIESILFCKIIKISLEKFFIFEILIIILDFLKFSKNLGIKVICL